MSTSKGLGDTVEKVASALKIDVVVEKVAKMAGKEDCGCKKRKQLLNEKFPYNR